MKNATIDSFAHNELKRKIALCTKAQQRIFIQMYSHKNPEKPINDIINGMKVEDYYWALTQIENTIRKNEEKWKKYVADMITMDMEYW